jgi:hypothetical protein
MGGFDRMDQRIVWPPSLDVRLVPIPFDLAGRSLDGMRSRAVQNFATKRTWAMPPTLVTVFH